MSVAVERAERFRRAFLVVWRFVFFRRWPLFAALGAIAGVFGVQALVKHPSEWLDVFVLAAGQLLAGEDIYPAETFYLYPPFMAAAVIPFTVLPPLVSRAAWYLISLACIAGMVRIAWKLAGGPGLRELRKAPSREWLALLLGLCCAVTYILNTLAHQQLDIIIGFLLLCGCHHLLAKRDVAAGLCLGIAAACKATPLLWAPYLACRRRWLAAALVGATAIAANLVPEFFGSAPGGGTWLGRWVARFVLPTQNINTALGHWGRGDVIYNQSLAGTVQRLVNTSLEFGSQGIEVVRTSLVAPVLLKLAVYSILAALVAVSVAAALRAERTATTAPPPSPIVIEFSIVLLLMLLMSPMSSQAHFVILILPGFCLARLALGTGDRTIGALLLGAALLSVLTNKDPVGAKAYNALLWGGSVTFAALLLWCGCVVALLRKSQPTVVAVEAGSSARRATPT